MNDTTRFEVEFIEGLGHWSTAGSRIHRAELLRRYIQAAERRENWDGIDRAEVIRAARRKGEP